LVSVPDIQNTRDERVPPPNLPFGSGDRVLRVDEDPCVEAGRVSAPDFLDLWERGEGHPDARGHAGIDPELDRPPTLH